MKAVYCVGILDFNFEETKSNKEEFIHTVQLKNQHNKVFYDKLKFVYLEMPNFNKKEHELETRLDKWLYFIKHLEDFENIPNIFKDQIFEQAFKQAEIAKYTKEERDEYEQSLKVYRDLKSVIDTAFDEGKLEGILEGERKWKLEGKLEGILEGKLEFAKILMAKGMSLDFIVETTGLTLEEVEKL